MWIDHGRKVQTVKGIAFAAVLELIVGNKETVPPDLFRDGRGIFGKGPCRLGKGDLFSIMTSISARSERVRCLKLPV